MRAQILIYGLQRRSDLFLFCTFTSFSMNKLTLLFWMVYKVKSAVYFCLAFND